MCDMYDEASLSKEILLNNLTNMCRTDLSVLALEPYNPSLLCKWTLDGFWKGFKGVNRLSKDNDDQLCFVVLHCLPYVTVQLNKPARLSKTRLRPSLSVR